MAAESFLVRALSTLIAEFNRRGLNYALAGGWAYSALVEPRATTDIDLLMLIEQPSREGIQSLLSPLGSPRSWLSGPRRVFPATVL